MLVDFTIGATMRKQFVAQARFELDLEKYNEWKHKVRRVMYALGYNSISQFITELVYYIVDEAGKKNSTKEIIDSMEDFFIQVIESAKSKANVNEKKVKVEDYTYKVLVVGRQ